MKLLIGILIIISSKFILGQGKENWMTMESPNNSVHSNKDTTKKYLQFESHKSGNVKIEADNRLDGLIKYAAEEHPDGGKIWGYRVQIYFDKSKDNTNKEIAKFKTRYGHETGCYIQYKAPNYRIKVGDFRTEIEAEHFKQNILGIFPTAFVVRERIKLPRINLKEETSLNEDQSN